MKPRISPIDFVPNGSNLKFIKQTVFSGNIKAEYECSCGNVVERYVYQVKTGRSSHCGCLKRRRTKHPLDYVPPKSKLTFIRMTSYLKIETIKGKRVCISQNKALYKCQCGAEKESMVSVVQKGNTISCGCFRKDLTRFKSYGLHTHPLYRRWVTMLSRCYDTNNVQYQSYGGRGVFVCEEWKNDFMSYFNWCMENGWEKGKQIDKDIKAISQGREANEYSPEWCSIVSTMENNSLSSKRGRLFNIKIPLKSVEEFLFFKKEGYVCYVSVRPDQADSVKDEHFKKVLTSKISRQLEYNKKLLTNKKQKNA